jgi:hypothetical protein
MERELVWGAYETSPMIFEALQKAQSRLQSQERGGIQMLHISFIGFDLEASMHAQLQRPNNPQMQFP